MPSVKGMAKFPGTTVKGRRFRVWFTNGDMREFPVGENNDSSWAMGFLKDADPQAGDVALGIAEEEGKTNFYCYHYRNGWTHFKIDIEEMIAMQKLSGEDSEDA